MAKHVVIWLKRLMRTVCLSYGNSVGVWDNLRSFSFSFLWPFVYIPQTRTLPSGQPSGDETFTKCNQLERDSGEVDMTTRRLHLLPHRRHLLKFYQLGTIPHMPKQMTMYFPRRPRNKDIGLSCWFFRCRLTWLEQEGDWNIPIYLCLQPFLLQLRHLCVCQVCVFSILLAWFSSCSR